MCATGTFCRHSFTLHTEIKFFSLLLILFSRLVQYYKIIIIIISRKCLSNPQPKHIYFISESAHTLQLTKTRRTSSIKTEKKTFFLCKNFSTFIFPSNSTWEWVTQAKKKKKESLGNLKKTRRRQAYVCGSGGVQRGIFHFFFAWPVFYFVVAAA